MTTPTLLAAGAAAAAYYSYSYSRGGGGGGDGEGGADAGPQTHLGVHEAPRGFWEELWFLAEGLRYTYGETLGRWRTADLLVGLAYLARRGGAGADAAADVAAAARPWGEGLPPGELAAGAARLRDLERFFRYCSALRQRRADAQRGYFAAVLGVPPADVLEQSLAAGVLKPSYVLVRDEALRAVVLAVRGTHSWKDAMTSLTGASRPHHVVDSEGVVLGYSHFGMLAAARWLRATLSDRLAAALAASPGYSLKVVGHSLGGGTAAMLTMMLREAGGPFAGATCVAIACPACMTLELARSCAGYVTTVVNGNDIIPTISPGSMDALRAEVTRSAWAREFRRDVRAHRVVAAVEAAARGAGAAAASGVAWTRRSLSAAYSGAAGRAAAGLKRRNSDDALAARGGGDQDAAEGAAERLPLSRSAPGSQSGALAGAGGAGSGEWRAAASATFAAWSTRVVTLSGRGAQALSASSAAAARSTAGLLSRVWPPRYAAAAAAEPDDLASPTGGGGGEPMDADDASDEGEDDGVADEDDAEARAGALRALQNEASLQTEADERWREVAAAVHAAEDEEAAAPGAADPPVPRGAGAGAPAPPASSSSPPSRRDTQWRRRMYPAGRIMHLVPSRLVYGADDPDAEACAPLPGWHRHTRTVSELSLPGVVGGEEALPAPAGAADSVEDAVAAFLAAERARLHRPPEPMVLLDAVPQEVYGRVRLCRVVVEQHIIPAYLQSLESALQRVDAQVARAAAAAAAGE